MKVTTAIIFAILGLGVEAQNGQPKGAPCGKGLMPCQADLYCKKLDTNCIDVRNEGNCIGNCQPRGFGGSTPGANGISSIPQPAPKNYPPQQLPPRPQPGGFPPQQQGGGYPPQQGGYPPQQQQPGGNRKPPPAQQSNGWLTGVLGNPITPIPIRQCPSNMRCSTGDVCVPHPRQQTYLCVSAEVECGKTLLIFNKNCPAGQACLANPKYTCDKQTGMCQGNDGICVPPPP